ncbi:AraC family transcriptional regulator [Actinoplanes sp. L3-i22]|uniref:AraC family transcriptional regulator n=1 Tax=Actinoplanes sp. L3-i22 TaxID=2836373 RepID=UPI001C793B5D|nr:AraC family transcriptional regulator [Actinoplanes sp. L3-i22]BCY08990.1 AraC family transcriptional regulator [Actinoplanes sp. L3-i22]
MDVITEALRSVKSGFSGARLIRCSGTWGMRFQAFEGIGFHIVLEGEGWLIEPDGRHTPVGPGDAVLIPGGAEHGLSHTRAPLAGLTDLRMGPIPAEPGPADFAFLCGAHRLDRGRAHPYLRAMPDVVVVRPDYDADLRLRSLADLLGADVAERGPGAETTQKALIDLMIVHALRRWQAENAPSWPAVSDDAVSAALSEIHRNPQRPWTVQDLSAKAGLSRAAFTRRFTALVGQPPMAYLTQWRLGRGARLLRETGEPLAAIARQVGYGSEFAFAGAFRRAYGIAPGRFRSEPLGDRPGG